MTLTQITEKGIKDGEIVNADINASAAIAGSKIAPSFTANTTITAASPVLRLADSTDPVGTDGVVGKLEFFGSDGSSGGADVRSFIQTISTNSVGNAHALTIGLGESNNAPTEKIRILGDGKVGIGATSVDRLFHVEGTDNVLGKFQNDQSICLIEFEDTDTTAGNRPSIGSDGNELIVYTGGGEKLRVDNNGNLGIGTDNAGARLYVHSSTSNTCATFESSDSGAVINLTDPSARSSIEQNGTDLKIQSDTSAQHASSTIKLQVDGSTKMTIDNNGNVLIGTNTSANVASSASAFLQVEVDSGGIPAAFYSTVDASGPSGVLALGHGRGSIGGVLQDNDIIGHIRFAGGDGTDCQTQGAAIRAEVNGTPSSNNMPADLVFYTNGGAVSVGERVRILKGGGMTFNGDTSTDNALDDYEEGTFTPAMYGSTTAGSITYTYQNGVYTKIGNKITVSVNLAVSSIGSAAGNMRISGFPFAPKNATEGVTVAQWNQLGAGLPSGTSNACPILQNPNTFCEIRCNNNAGSVFTTLPVQTVLYFRFIMTYFTA